MRRPTTTALLVSTLFLAAAHLPAQAPASFESHDRIRGTVINIVTREPIPRALVYSQDNRFATLTDDRGRFDLPWPRIDATPTSNAGSKFSSFAQPSGNLGYLQPEQPAVLLARKPGFLPRGNGQETVVERTRMSENLVIALVPECHIVGRIVLPGSGDVADYSDLAPIRVTLLRRTIREGGEHWDQQNEVEAGSNGEFRFFNLSAGTYKLLTNEVMDRDPLSSGPSAQLYGFPPVFFPSAVDADSAASIGLSPGETFQATLALERREYYRVRLPVINAPDNTRLRVQVWPVGHPGPGYSLGFDFFRKAVRGSLPNGTYSVLLAGFNGGGGAGTATFTIRGGDISSPAITIVPNPSISVVFHEEFSTPSETERLAKGVGGSLGSRMGNPLYRAMLMPEGPYLQQRQIEAGVTSNPEHSYYAFDSVPPGKYRMRVFGQTGYAAAIRAGGTDLLRDPLIVGFGSAPPEIEVTMRDDGGSVFGELVAPVEKNDEIRPQLSGTTSHPVYFFPVSGNGTFTTAWAAPDGKFGVNNVAPGVYAVLGFDHQQFDLEQEGQLDLHEYEGTVQQITVSPRQNQTIRVPMIAASE